MASRRWGRLRFAVGKLALIASMAMVVAACGAGTPTGPGPGVGQSPDGGGSPPVTALPDAGSTLPPDAGVPPAAPETQALLVVHAMDIWAQPLPAADASLRITRQGQTTEVTGFPVATVKLTEETSFEIDLSAAAHESLHVQVTYDGSDALGGARVLAGTEDAGRYGLSMSHGYRVVEGRRLPVHNLFLGLRHKWFSAQGRPARRGNRIRLMLSGEEAWGAVHQALNAATESILLATWWWDSEFELVRDWEKHHLQSESERWPNTILGTLEASPAHKRVLVGEFWGDHSILDFITRDSALKYYAEQAGDGFEFMGQGNPTSGVFWFEPSRFSFQDRVLGTDPSLSADTWDADSPIASTVEPHLVDFTDTPLGIDVQIASYHQKFMVIDHGLAFVGGMNMKAVDWDSEDHLVFDHRRMDFDASASNREEVVDKDDLPDHGPRKDYMLRIEGPSAQDVADVFHRRWSHQLDTGAEYSQNSSRFSVVRNIAPKAQGSQVQITATLPQPFWEHGIIETWLNAVAQARDYIYIEDQYWRIPILVDAIVTRMQQVPGLRLVVITKPVSEWTDPGCEWTHWSHQKLKTLFPLRYRTYQLRAFDTVVTWGWDETESRYQDIDVHSKMLIVDDVFMSIGSANKNNRGAIYEGELNAAVYDPAWVRAQRRRILANLLPAGVAPTDDVDLWWTQLAQAAAHNDAVYGRWDEEGWDIDLGDGSLPLPASYTPRGFLHGLDFRAVHECLIEGVGPDLF